MNSPHENSAMIYAGLASEMAIVLERVYGDYHDYLTLHNVIPNPATQAVVEALLDLHKAVRKANPIYVE